MQENHKGAYGHVEFKFKSFQEFYDEVGPRPEGKTLDRIDPWGNYEPGNVRWATHVEQCNNRRKKKMLNGKSKKQHVNQESVSS